MRKVAWALVLAGFVVLAAGTLMVWSDNAPFSENGVDRSSGVVALVAAIGAGAVALADRRPRGMLIAVSAGALSLILALADYADISSNSGADIGTGLYVSIAGALIATLAAGFVAFSLFKKPAGRKQVASGPETGSVDHF